MRIASFNIRGGGSWAHWAELIESVAPDVVLVQETRDPAGFSLDLASRVDLGDALWAPVGHGRWGSALLFPSGGLRRVEVPGFEGWVVGGECQIGDAAFHVFSVHLPPERSSYVRAANSMLDAIRPIVGDGALILGGDWNVTVSRGPPAAPLASRKAGLRLLDRLEAEFGLRSAWDLANPDAPLAQTLRWARNPTTPYHCDGVFLPASLADAVEGVRVLDGSPWTELSDHNPVVVEVGVRRPP